jgi:hypothetical protein
VVYPIPLDRIREEAYDPERLMRRAGIAPEIIGPHAVAELSPLIVKVELSWIV